MSLTLHIFLQAAVLADKYKRWKGAARLRTSDLSQLGHVTRGLLPSDLDHMMDSLDDVLDLAEEVKETQGHLTSGQVSEGHGRHGCFQN